MKTLLKRMRFCMKRGNCGEEVVKEEVGTKGIIMGMAKERVMIFVYR